jgi:hypothetical protein
MGLPFGILDWRFWILGGLRGGAQSLRPMQHPMQHLSRRRMGNAHHH